MPSLICNNCNKITNTACSNHLSPCRNDGKANECYCYFEEGKWEKGCAWEKLSDMEKRLFFNMIVKTENISNEFAKVINEDFWEIL